MSFNSKSYLSYRKYKLHRKVKALTINTVVSGSSIETKTEQQQQQSQHQDQQIEQKQTLQQHEKDQVQEQTQEQQNSHQIQNEEQQNQTQISTTSSSNNAQMSSTINLAKEAPLPSISILKPLMGVDPNLLQNLETFFTMNYETVGCLIN